MGVRDLMAPTVTLHAFAPNDLNGAVLHTITDEDPYLKSLTLKVEREGLGGAELVLSRTAGAEMFAFTPELFFRVLVHAYSDTVYYPWGFFLNKRQATVIHRDEDGAEEWHLGGAGPKMYLDRAALGIGGPLSGWNVDLENGVWRWGDSATVGRILGRIIAQDGNLSDPALPDLTTTFDQTDDSSSVAWTETSLGSGTDPYTIPIGTSLLESLWDLEDLLELTSWIELGTVASPKFELNVSQGLGADKTGNVFGSGVCLLREGVNIADDALKVEGHSLRKASHVIVEGDRGKWAVAERPTFTPGDYVKYAKISYTRSGSVYWLEKAGIRWLKRQDNGEKSLSVEIVPGQSDATGLYFPAPDRNLWLSNLISVDTSADGSTHTPLDIQPSEDQLVTGFLLETHTAADDADATAQARSWDVTVYLNRERPGNIQKTPDQKSAASGGGGCKCIRLCGPGFIESDLTWKVLEHASQASGDINPEPSGWKELGFDDSGWDDPIEIWYSEPNLPSEAVAISGVNAVNQLRRHEHFFRKEFWVSADDLTGSDVPFRVFCDDGIVVYVNGVSVLSLNTPWSGGATVHNSTLARSVFQAGWNSVAVYLWNQGGGSDGSNPNPGPTVFQLQIEIPSADHGMGSGGSAARCDHTHRVDEVTGLPVPSGQVFRPSDYGAVVDGSTDDTAAFDDARAAAEVAGAGSIIELDEGTMVIDPTAMTRFTVSGLTIRGRGRASVIKWKAGTYNLTDEGLLNFEGSSGNEVVDIVLEDFDLDGNRSNVTNTGNAFAHEGVHVNFGVHPTIRDVHSRHFHGEGFDFDNTIGHRVIRCIAEDCGGSGFHTSTGSSHGLFTDCLAIDCGVDNSRSGFDTWDDSLGLTTYLRCKSVQCNIGFSTRNDDSTIIDCEDFDSTDPLVDTGTGNDTSGLTAHKRLATAAPGVTDDEDDAFRVGSTWYDTTNDLAYTCVDASSGAAEWTQIGGGGDHDDEDHSTVGHYELLMTGSSPPEPLEDGTGNDWLYVWVN